MSRLTPKQKAFVDQFLVDLNGTQAAIRAGYSENSANPQAARLLAKASVQEAVQDARAKQEQRTHITQDFVLERLRIEAMGDGPDTNANARIRASELLGKHQGLFTDKVQVENVGAPPIIQVQFGKPPEKDTAT